MGRLGLRSLELEAVYDSGDGDIVARLVVPLLSHSKYYQRGVGFFTSGWLKVAAEGLVGLVENGGMARIVLSPQLQAMDWQALERGHLGVEDATFREALRASIDDLRASLRADTLNCLAWMVADRVLEFRFAVPRRGWAHGVYHDKVWVFKDNLGDIVALHGSFNDSVQGTLNGEAVSVFRSWEPGQVPFVQRHRERLDALWSDQNRQLRVLTIPEAAREWILDLRSTPHRPYRLPQDASHPGDDELRVPVELWRAQLRALDQWEEAGRRGVLEMATGTGKTVTALAAAVRVFRSLGSVALLVEVPFLHLVEQWAGECRKFGFEPIPCSSAASWWERELCSQASNFRLGLSRSLCAIAVHDTASSDRFLRAVAGLPPKSTLLVADEAHCLGARSLRAALVPTANLRMGLSATPQRWLDPEGTSVLLAYFGSVCFSYPIGEAIGVDLARYRYLPTLVELAPDEISRYQALSAAIARLLASEGEEDDPERLRSLLLARARLVWNAENKLPALLGLVARLRKQSEEPLSRSVVFAGPGTHRAVLSGLSSLGLRCHEFVHTVSARRRQQVLADFAAGRLDALVAVRCLDEGMDVPSTSTALILASTSNPRQFIQRRGRILRRTPEKDLANIHDFVVVPPSDPALHVDQSVGASLLRREMPRFSEFASSSENEFEARGLIYPILERYGLIHLLDAEPGDIFSGDRELLTEAELIPSIPD